MKKVLALFIALLCALAILPSCAQQTEDEVTTPAPVVTDRDTETLAETTARDYPVIPAGTDLNGKEFCILYYNAPEISAFTAPCDIWVENTQGEALIDSVYNRNLTVEEALKVKITMFDPGKGNYVSSLQTSYKSGELKYSMCDVNCNTVPTLINNGLINSVSCLNTDYTKPWYDQKTNSQFTICGKQYAFAPDTLFIDKLETVVTFYNKKYGDDLGIGSLHQTAKDGKFTLDLMLQYANKVSADLNQDGKMDKNDAYCISCQNDYGYFALLSAGLSSYATTKDGIEFNLNKENVVDVLTKTSDIMKNTAIFFNRQTYNLPLSEVTKMFASKQNLFLIRPLQTLYDLRDVDQNFEILPSAKYSADQQEYSSPVNTYAATIFCVPRGRNDYNDVALVSDLLAAESHYSVMPIFYDLVLDYKLVNDPGAAEILDIVFETRAYDLGIIFNIGGVRSLLVAQSMNNISSVTKSIEKQGKTQIDKLIETVNSTQDS